MRTHNFRIGSSADIVLTRLSSTRRDARAREVTKANVQTLRRLSQSAYSVRSNLMVGSYAEVGSYVGRLIQTAES